MSSDHLSRDEFFSQLEQLFTRRQGSDHGAIYLTQKRQSVSYDQDLLAPTSDNPFPDLKPSQPLPILVRATNGKSKKNRQSKIKLSTVVQPADLEAFYLRYADICKLGMTTLKPRDRSRKKAKAKKKKATA